MKQETENLDFEKKLATDNQSKLQLTNSSEHLSTQSLDKQEQTSIQPSEKCDEKKFSETTLNDQKQCGNQKQHKNQKQVKKHTQKQLKNQKPGNQPKTQRFIPKFNYKSPFKSKIIAFDIMLGISILAALGLFIFDLMVDSQILQINNQNLESDIGVILNAAFLQLILEILRIFGGNGITITLIISILSILIIDSEYKEIMQNLYTYGKPDQEVRLKNIMNRQTKIGLILIFIGYFASFITEFMYLMVINPPVGGNYGVILENIVQSTEIFFMSHYVPMIGFIIILISKFYIKIKMEKLPAKETIIVFSVVAVIILIMSIGLNFLLDHFQYGRIFLESELHIQWSAENIFENIIRLLLAPLFYNNCPLLPYSLIGCLGVIIAILMIEQKFLLYYRIRLCFVACFMGIAGLALQFAPESWEFGIFQGYTLSKFLIDSGIAIITLLFTLMLFDYRPLKKGIKKLTGIFGNIGKIALSSWIWRSFIIIGLFLTHLIINRIKTLENPNSNCEFIDSVFYNNTNTVWIILAVIGVISLLATLSGLISHKLYSRGSIERIFYKIYVNNSNMHTTGTESSKNQIRNQIDNMSKSVMKRFSKEVRREEKAKIRKKRKNLRKEFRKNLDNKIKLQKSRAFINYTEELTWWQILILIVLMLAFFFGTFTIGWFF